jgi:hypothetical protein
MAQKEILNVESQCCKLMPMMSNAIASGNAKKVLQLQMTVAELLTVSLRRGFFGSITVEFNVQDGTIQYIRRKVEQIEK